MEILLKIKEDRNGQSSNRIRFFSEKTGLKN